MKSIVSLEGLRGKDVGFAGGKAANLGELIAMGLNVPRGFVVTTDAYSSFHGKRVPKAFSDELYATFDKMGMKHVAVRSSATVEDSEKASWAGELETYLDVGRGGLVDAVRRCWDSMDSERAKAYGKAVGIRGGKVAVVVQEMIDSDVSGVCFTAHPVTKNRSRLFIEACFGWGEALVGGMITPDAYLVDKRTLDILEKVVNNQEVQMRSGGKKRVWEGSAQKLSDKRIKDVAKRCIQIERHYGRPQDIEFALNDDVLYFLQTRPITTL